MNYEGQAEVPGFQIERFNDPVLLLEALLPWNNRWGPRPADWLFRGQRDSVWKLDPVALRPTTRFSYGEKTFTPSSDSREQIAAERNVLRAFLKEIDAQGQPLPIGAGARWLSDHAYFYEEVMVADPKQWPPVAILPLLALAQHHGIPTRLLDWTLHGWVAAYFAAVDLVGVTTEISNADAAIWCLDWRRAGAGIACGLDVADPLRREIEVIRTPQSTDVNQRAQRGIFTILHDRNQGFGSPCEDHRIDVLLEEGLPIYAARNGTIDPPVVRKIEFPVGIAGGVLKHLSLAGVNAATLFPGYDGVVRGMRERGFWTNKT